MERQARLFEPGELRLKRQGLARLAEIVASLPEPRRTARERRADDDRTTMEKLRRLGAELATHFGLRYAGIEAERPGVIAHYGICYADGTIRIRLRHAKTGRLLKESSLVDTLCHELAHLKHFDHSLRFRRFYARILYEARKRGHYRPGPERTPPRQCALFAGPAGGHDREE